MYVMALVTQTCVKSTKKTHSASSSATDDPSSVGEPSVGYSSVSIRFRRPLISSLRLRLTLVNLLHCSRSEYNSS